MKKTTMLMGLLYLLAATSFGQTTLPKEKAATTRNINFQWGLHALARQDQVFSPMIKRDFSPKNMQINYQRTTGRAKSMVALLFDQYTPDADNAYTYLAWPDGKKKASLSTSTTVVSLRYGYAKRIRDGAVFLGVITDNQVNAGEYGYGANSTFGYFAHFSVAPWLVYDWSLSDKLSLFWQTSLPLFSWVTRSPYGVNDDAYMKANASHNEVKTFFAYVGNGKLQGINRFQKMNLQVNLTYAISKKTDLLAAYQVEFLRHTQPRTMVSYQNYFNTGIQLKF